jgi:hypothetical protein
MKRFFFFTFLLLSFWFCNIGRAEALTLSPVREEVSGDPGQTISGEVTLFNEQKEKKTFYSSFENFEAQGENGSPNFIPGKVGLATWIKTQEKIELGPEERKSIPFTINIPSSAESGGYFAAIFWSTNPEASSTDAGKQQLGLGAKVGTLVMLKVNGKVKETSGILEFSPTAKKKVFESLPIEFSLRLQNSGGDRIMPQGEIKIKNFFGFTVATIPVNQSRGNILPNSARKFTATWAGKQSDKADKNNLFGDAGKEWRNLRFGYYKAQLNLQYGSSGQLKAKYGFFLFPWQLMIITIMILVVLGVVAFFGIKKYNKWIVSKAAGDWRK